MSFYAQGLLDVHDELIVDLFAGGGGASSGIEQATGRMVDIAINHDPIAVSMHIVNHPHTRHFVSDVFEVCPRTVTEGRPVGFLWASPDCTYHSKARGGVPIRDANKKRRALAWVVKRWAGQVSPRVIMLENVEEFLQWGPLVGPKDNLRPCKKRRGKRFRQFAQDLRNLGYRVEWKELRACDYGAPTIRKRFFMIARRDGEAIVWPEPTHGAPAFEGVKSGQLKPWRTAAECIDWSIPMLSIFATPQEAKEWGELHGQQAPKRPLVDNTMRRVARGIKRFVIDNPKPFLVSIAHGETSRNGGDRWGSGVRDLGDPYSTNTCTNQSVIAARLVKLRGTSTDADPQDPLGTISAGGTHHAVVAAFMSHNNTGYAPSSAADDPLHTIVAEGAHHNVVAAHIQRDFGQSVGHGADEPLGTVTGGGMGKAQLVTSFMLKYYGTGDGQELSEPSHTTTTKDRFGLVTLTLTGFVRYISDICMRMLQPKELYAAQGFPPSYVIDRGHDGRMLTKTQQVHMCGNSVAPPVAKALVLANCPELVARHSRPLLAVAS